MAESTYSLRGSVYHDGRLQMALRAWPGQSPGISSFSFDAARWHIKHYRPAQDSILDPEGTVLTYSKEGRDKQEQVWRAKE